MTRHVNKTKSHAVFIEKSESQINGDTAPFLLFQAIGVRACQRLDQRGLAVINVSRSADDDALGQQVEGAELFCSGDFLDYGLGRGARVRGR
jgi:hypothetical protein